VVKALSYNPLDVGSHPGDWLKFPTIPLIVGIVSGLLTAEAARLLGPFHLFLGAVFGAALLLLVWLKHKSCSVWLAAALTASSVVAYAAAVWATVFLIGLSDRMLGPHFADPGGPRVFALAGFLGALILSLALLLLLSLTRGLRLLGKAAAWSCGGAFLGFLASELSDPMGAAVAAIAGHSPPETRAYYQALDSAYLVWQTGMAFLVPLMLPHEAGRSVSIPRSPATLPILGKLFFAGILAVLLILGYVTARDEFRNQNVQRKTVKLVRKMSSAGSRPFLMSPKCSGPNYIAN
jgi:hypothetical protein